MYSDRDIEDARELNQQDADKGILITPFSNKCLTPVGYDLRVGNEGFSWQKKTVFNIEQEGKITIDANDIVVVRTLEDIHLSKKIGATIHSIVSLVALDRLSHISTTIDPGWQGKLLISIHNYGDRSVELEFRQRLCTICFYDTKSEAKESRGDKDRDELWLNLRRKATDEKQRQEQLEKQKERDKQRAARQRIIYLSIFAVMALVIGVGTSLFNPILGASVAAIIGGISPLFVEILKR
jgi:deoxycytidine triphosphate deaminase